jgi:hypothetical protein
MNNPNLSQTDSSHKIFKMMLLGDISTGKTSFLTQLIYQSP